MSKSSGAITDWSELRQVAHSGFKDAVTCLAIIAVVDRANNPVTVQSMRECGSNKAAELLAGAGIDKVLIYVVRAFAPVRHKDDRHLRAAINFITSKQLRPHVQCAADYQLLCDAISAFEAASSDPALRRLTTWRNKQVAHVANYDFDADDRPNYEDLFALARAVADIWEKLALGTVTTGLTVASQVRAYHESAERLWSRFDVTD